MINTDRISHNGIEIANELHKIIFPQNLHYFITSYGCQMNAHDSENIAGILEKCGYTCAKSIDDADLLLYNTCCVREHAEKRVFGNIGALKKRKDQQKGLIIGVCGCMMQQEEVAKRFYQRYPFVNLIFGTNCLHKLPGLLKEVIQGERILDVNEINNDIIEGLPVKRIPGVSASVNIMYGCDNYCSYCIVPYVRGRERSRQVSDIIKEVEQLSREGYSEVLLLGQNVNSFSGNGGETDFPALLRIVNKVKGIKRIRFMTSHPKDLSDELIKVIAECENVCKHIHLPIQSGSDEILKKMNRCYTRDNYLSLVKNLRKSIPEIEITTDVIVGFPGETDIDFQKTLDIVEEIGFSAAYTFMFSPREGTKAAKFDNQLDDALKRKRLSLLNALQEEQTKKTNMRYIGTKGEILVEGCDNKKDIHMLHGKLSNFKMVYFPGEADKIGKYVTISITDIHKNSLIGTMLPERQL